MIRTLDDRDIVITVLPGEVTKHGEVKCVLNEGLYPDLYLYMLLWVIVLGSCQLFLRRHSKVKHFCNNCIFQILS